MTHLRRTSQIGVARSPSPSASQRLPGGRTIRGPATSQRVPRGGAPSGSTSRRIPGARDTHSTRTRPEADPAAQKRTIAMVGGIVGALVVILIGVLALGGSKPPPKPKTKPAPARTLDAAGHAREAAVRGEDGIRKGREAVARYEKTRGSLGEAERSSIVELLEDANSDLESALAHFEQASNMTSPGVSLGVNEKKFIEMRKEVRRHLLELKK